VNEDKKIAAQIDELQKPVGSVSVLASEEEPQHVPVSFGIDDDFDDEPLPARTCTIDGEECESCQ
jgi:hypothetical protein